jgi:magnesium transporter
MNKLKRANLLQVADDDEEVDALEDIIIDNSQALEMSNVYANILNGTMDAFASIISNNLNEVVRRLTSITVILMLPTLVASLYGMNVRLPFSKHPQAFFIVGLVAHSDFQEQALVLDRSFGKKSVLGVGFIV